MQKNLMRLAGAIVLVALLMRFKDRIPGFGPAPQLHTPPTPPPATPPAAHVDTPPGQVGAPADQIATGAGRSTPVDLDEPAILAADDDIVAREEAAAAAEAAAIGGVVAADSADPALDPVLQAGGGEAEGFELAEQALIENASHGDAHGNPLLDAAIPEAEADRATGIPGEADHARSSEVEQ